MRLRKRDVIFAETDNKAVKVYTRLGIYEAKINMKKMRGILDSPMFAIPHNSYTVNMNFVYDCGPDEIFIQIPGSRICIYFSEKRKHEFRRQYYNYISFERK